VTSQAITADAAGTWTLGDLTVNRIGFGAMRLTSNADGSPSKRSRVIAVLRRALELGVNHIDTAAFYFSSLRSANELINHALAPYPEDLVIATKGGQSAPAAAAEDRLDRRGIGPPRPDQRTRGRRHRTGRTAHGYRGAAPIRGVDFVTLADLTASCSGPSAQPAPEPFPNRPRRG
jgi:aldo/keto reductase family protein